MKKKWLFLSWLGLLVFPSQAQQLRLAYYGETFTHYGLKVAYEHPMRVRLRDSKVQHAWLFAPGLAGYRHPHNHIGLVVSPEFTYRLTGRRGGLMELAFSPSYFRYFLQGRTFEVAEDGSFRQVPLAGRSAFLPTVSLGIGNDLSVRRYVPIVWYARLNVMQQRPYNASSLLRFGIEAGVIKPLRSRTPRS